MIGSFTVNTGRILEIILTGTLQPPLGANVGAALSGNNVNTGTITGFNHPGVLIHTDTATDKFTIHPKREISVSKSFTSIVYADDDNGSCAVATAPGNVCPVYGSGDQLGFEIIVINTGNTGIANLRVDDTFTPNDLINLT